VHLVIFLVDCAPIVIENVDESPVERKWAFFVRKSKRKVPGPVECLILSRLELGTHRIVLPLVYWVAELFNCRGVRVHSTLCDFDDWVQFGRIVRVVQLPGGGQGRLEAVHYVHYLVEVDLGEHWELLVLQHCEYVFGVVELFVADPHQENTQVWQVAQVAHDLWDDGVVLVKWTPVIAKNAHGLVIDLILFFDQEFVVVGLHNKLNLHGFCGALISLLCKQHFLSSWFQCIHFLVVWINCFNWTQVHWIHDRGFWRWGHRCHRGSSGVCVCRCCCTPTWTVRRPTTLIAGASRTAVAVTTIRGTSTRGTSVVRCWSVWWWSVWCRSVWRCVIRWTDCCCYVVLLCESVGFEWNFVISKFTIFSSNGMQLIVPLKHALWSWIVKHVFIECVFG